MPMHLGRQTRARLTTSPRLTNVGPDAPEPPHMLAQANHRRAVADRTERRIFERVSADPARPPMRARRSQGCMNIHDHRASRMRASSRDEVRPHQRAGTGDMVRRGRGALGRGLAEGTRSCQPLCRRTAIGILPAASSLGALRRPACHGTQLLWAEEADVGTHTEPPLSQVSFGCLRCSNSGLRAASWTVLSQAVCTTQPTRCHARDLR